MGVLYYLNKTDVSKKLIQVKTNWKETMAPSAWIHYWPSQIINRDWHAMNSASAIDSLPLTFPTLILLYLTPYTLHTMYKPYWFCSHIE